LRSYFIFLLFLIYPLKGISQFTLSEFQNTSDSLKINLAKTYFKEKEFDEAINICISLNESIEAYNIMAESYDKLGDFYKSIDYYEKLISINSKNNNLEKLFENYTEISKIHYKLLNKENYEISIQYLKNAIELSTKVTISDLELHSIYNNLGSYYYRLKNKPLALESQIKAFQIAKKINNKKEIELSLCNIGNLYFNGIETNTEDLKIAKKYFNESLKYGREFCYYNYLNLGIIDYLFNKPETALDYYNKALNCIDDLILNSSEIHPTFKSIQTSINKDKIVGILYEKYYSQIKIYTKTKNKHYLTQAFKSIELIDFTLDAIFMELKDERSQLFWKKKASSIYLLGVHISYILNNPEKAFYFTEKNKAMLLLNNVFKSKSSYKIPLGIRNKELELKKEIYNLKHLLKSSPKDSIKNLLFNKQRVYDKFKDSLNSTFEKDLFSEINKTLSSLKNAQEELTDNNTLIISYIWDKTENQYDALFGVAITKQNSLVFKIDGLENFNKSIETYRKIISKPFNNASDIEFYKNESNELFNRLFPNDTVKKLVKNHTKLIVIPDSDLQYIPFESLITNNNDYLIKSHEISYLYSMSFLKENRKLNRNPESNLIGFAPSTFTNKNLNNLPRSITEVETIKNLIGGEIFIKSKAKKNIFLSQIKHYQIIHLSTHADANDSISPWIAFNDEKLYLNELYTTKTQASLVVLSTCKSSLGKINSGEGVFSLARGFFYSGANSVISSLWNVNDKSTEEIIINFYKYIKKGEPKSKALRYAKLDYLNSHSLSELSPFYWSPLILIGDDSSINLSNHNWGYILILSFISIILFFLSKKKKIIG